MINFYDPSVIDTKRKELKKHRAIFYLSLIISVAIEILFCVFIEYKNKNVMQPLMIAVGMLLSALLVFLYCYFVFPDKWIIKRYNLMNDSIKHELTGVVESIKENVTLRRDVVGKEISFIVDGKSIVLYLEDEENKFQFVVGKKYVVTTYDNFIVTAEEKIDE